MASLQEYLLTIDKSFEKFQCECWKRNDDDDLRLYYAQKDVQRNDRFKDRQGLSKLVNDFEAEAFNMVQENKELKECIKRGGKFCEVGSAPGGGQVFK